MFVDVLHVVVDALPCFGGLAVGPVDYHLLHLRQLSIILDRYSGGCGVARMCAAVVGGLPLGQVGHVEGVAMQHVGALRTASMSSISVVVTWCCFMWWWRAVATQD